MNKLNKPNKPIRYLFLLVFSLVIIYGCSDNNLITGAVVGGDGGSIGVQAITLSTCNQSLIGERYTLSSDVTNESTCFQTSGADVELDCAGYSVTYATGGTGGNGVNSENDNVTVKNCIFIEIEHGGFSNNALDLSHSNNHNLTNNSVYTNGSYNNAALYLMNVTESTINNNTLISNGVGDSNNGITVTINSTGNNITNNIISTNGTFGNYGIRVDDDSHNNTFENIEITTNGTENGTSGFNQGIFLSNNTTNNHFENINILTQGEANSSGIYLEFKSDSNTFVNVNITVSDLNTFEISDTTGSSEINYLVYNNSLGEIRWIDNGTSSFVRTLNLNVTNTGGFGLGKNLFIGNNTVAINTSAINTDNLMINSSVNITQYGTWLSNANHIVQDGDFNTDEKSILQRGLICSNPTCEFVNLSSGTATFNISLFDGSYALDGCGNIYSDHTLYRNINGTGSCLVIQNNSISIDCAGKTITYSETGSQYDAGIDINSVATDHFDNVTVKNCVIKSASETENEKGGINVFNSINHSFINNTILSNGENKSMGIFLKNISESIVINNSINASGVTSNNSGIWLELGSSFVNITGNTIYTNGTELSFGISLIEATNNILIIDNTIVSNGSSITNDGLYLDDAQNNTIKHNIITTKGGVGVEGILLSNYSTDNWLENNSVTLTQLRLSSGSYGVGIFTAIDSSNNTLLNNNITVSVGDLIFDTTGLSGPTPFNDIIYNNSFGEIRWLDNGSGSFLSSMSLNITNDLGFGLGQNLNISNNTVSLNTSAIDSSTSRMNGSANITMYSITLSEVTQILRVENYSTDESDILANGIDCINSGSCVNLSYNNTTGNLVFNTTGFSSFSANGTKATSVADTTTPNVQGFNSPTSGQSFSSGTIIINISVNDVSSSLDTIIFQISNTSTPFNLTASSTNASLYNATLNFSGKSMADGTHTITAFANDTAGNMNNSETISFTLDTSPATVATSSSSSSGSSSGSGCAIGFSLVDRKCVKDMGVIAKEVEEIGIDIVEEVDVEGISEDVVSQGADKQDIDKRLPLFGLAIDNFLLKANDKVSEYWLVILILIFLIVIVKLILYLINRRVKCHKMSPYTLPVPELSPKLENNKFVGKLISLRDKLSSPNKTEEFSKKLNSIPKLDDVKAKFNSIEQNQNLSEEEKSRIKSIKLRIQNLSDKAFREKEHLIKVEKTNIALQRENLDFARRKIDQEKKDMLLEKLNTVHSNIIKNEKIEQFSEKAKDQLKIIEDELKEIN